VKPSRSRLAHAARLSSLAAWLALAGAIDLTACAASTKLVQPLEGTPPGTIVVLPMDGDLSPRARAIVRRLLGSLIADRKYAKLDDELVDSRLAVAGHAPWNARWLPKDDALAAFGRTLAADALIVGEEFQDSRLSAGIFFRRGLTGRLRLIDSRSGKTIWSADVGSSSSGGLLTGSGQVIKALSETVEAGSEETFARLAASLALDAAETLPENPRPSEAPPPPRVSKVSVVRLRELHGDEAQLAAGDVVQIESIGTPGCRARASLGGGGVGVPLVEAAPGMYRAQVRIEPGQDGDGPAVATLYDAFGRASEPRRTEAAWQIRSPRLDPPAGVKAELSNARSRRVRVRWEPVPGASGYLIARLGGGAPVTLEPTDRLEIEEVVPAGSTEVAYVVSARSAAGTVGPPSAAVPVSVSP
jgi:hypothetical protein